MPCDLRVLERKVSRAYRDYEEACHRLRDEKKIYVASKSILRDTLEARRIAQMVAQAVQQQAHTKISGVVTHCLHLVFGPAYSFQIKFVQKRGKTEARLLLLKDRHVIEDPLDSDSGGVVDVAALALRIACLVLSKPHVRRLLVMDEPFKNLHGALYRERVRKMLIELSHRFSIQFIFVTGIESLIAGKVIRL